MIITASNISMAGVRRFQSEGTRSTDVALGNGGGFQNFLGKRLMEEPEETRELSKTGISLQTDPKSRFRYQVLDYLIQLLFGKQHELTERLRSYGGAGSTDSSGSFLFTQSYVYHEEEQVSFQTTGTVQTADGRQLDFNLELNLSRSFTCAYEKQFGLGSLPDFRDPLVINFDAASCDVTDQVFSFDLDADGHKELMHQLAPGSGFLALDRNKDGQINDGSELFGTASGNGVYDLAQYDQDHNGWIDEADEIFRDLMIYTRDRNGEDKLIGLGAAGVGAIYLGSAAGDFALNDLAANDPYAVIRSHGMFLFEDGRMGTVQQVDFAS